VWFHLDIRPFNHQDLYTHKITYVFLLWNLFLAWIPLAVANIFKQAFTNIMEACFSYFNMAGFSPNAP